jgi:hypothetical protein
MAEPTFDHDRRDVCRIPKPWKCSARYAREQWLRAAQPMTLSTAASPVSAALPAVYLDAGRGFEIYDAGKRGHRYLLGRELARQSLLVAAREELGCATDDRNRGQLLPEAGCVELDLLGVVGKNSRWIFLKKSPNEVEALGLEDYKTAHEVRLSHLVGTFERLSRVEMVAYLREAGLEGKRRRWVEQAAVASLRQALPDCEITFAEIPAN